MRGIRLTAVIAASGAFLVAPAAIVAQEGEPPATPAIGDARPALSVEEARTAEATPAVSSAFGDSRGAARTQRLQTSEDDKKATATASATRSVKIGDYFYDPDRLTIKQGDKVVWTNDGTVPEGHTVTGDSFDSAVIEEAGAYSHEFSDVGTFDYVCTLHDNMEGTVIVEERQGEDGGVAPDGDDPVDNSGDGGNDNTGGVSAGDNSGSEGSGSSGSGETDSGLDIPLASTGLDAGLLAIIGLNVLLLGLLVRVRVRGRAV